MTALNTTTLHDWRDDAACRDVDVDLFFAHDETAIEHALAYCRRCPVQQECLEHALENGERYGVWGGTTELERREIARRRRRRAA